MPIPLPKGQYHLSDGILYSDVSVLDLGSFTLDPSFCVPFSKTQLKPFLSGVDSFSCFKNGENKNIYPIVYYDKRTFLRPNFTVDDYLIIYGEFAVKDGKVYRVAYDKEVDFVFASNTGKLYAVLDNVFYEINSITSSLDEGILKLSLGLGTGRSANVFGEIAGNVFYVSSNSLVCGSEVIYFDKTDTFGDSFESYARNVVLRQVDNLVFILPFGSNKLGYYDADSNVFNSVAITEVPLFNEGYFIYDVKKVAETVYDFVFIKGFDLSYFNAKNLYKPLMGLFRVDLQTSSVIPLFLKSFDRAITAINFYGFSGMFALENDVYKWEVVNNGIEYTKVLSLPFKVSGLGSSQSLGYYFVIDESGSIYLVYNSEGVNLVVSVDSIDRINKKVVLKLEIKNSIGSNVPADVVFEILSDNFSFDDGSKTKYFKLAYEPIYTTLSYTYLSKLHFDYKVVKTFWG